MKVTSAELQNHDSVWILEGLRTMQIPVHAKCT